ncbi:MAG: hypothetical protein MPL62_03240, partial [Alphaproteobacteria bacterium]|nr:hypothetical protein [Alphaproteobacteria bacterium]
SAGTARLSQHRECPGQTPTNAKDRSPDVSRETLNFFFYFLMFRAKQFYAIIKKTQPGGTPPVHLQAHNFTQSVP